jgi:hypothetical protein
METKRVYSVYLKNYVEKHDLIETISDPKKIEGMIIQFIISLKKEKKKSYPAILQLEIIFLQF